MRSNGQGRVMDRHCNRCSLLSSEAWHISQRGYRLIRLIRKGVASTARVAGSRNRKESGVFHSYLPKPAAYRVGVRWVSHPFAPANGIETVAPVLFSYSERRSFRCFR
jgi:hypothetical protein